MKSFKSSRISASTSMQAIAAEARRAAAISAVDRLTDKPKVLKTPKKPKQLHKPSQIEMETRSIRASLSASAGNGITLVNDTPGHFSSAYAIISLYNDDEVAAHDLAKKLRKSDPTVKVPKLCPVVKYVLFPSAIDSTRLGSVAIYCRNACMMLGSIIRTGYLLGIPIKSATLEYGVCEYVDVLLRS